ncbi:MAG: CAP domain-containing protein [Ilumatobacter sp.]|uniref:CAP domain-containing protein n=1 Tax=Ilumatobacter sp. TaxID=1967498 RepID=UPI0032988CB8
MVALGTIALIPDGPGAIFASARPEFSELLRTDGVQTARRVTPVPVAPAPEALAPAPATESSEDRFTREVVKRTNAERAALGIPPLTVIPKLALAASFHAQDQKNQSCRSDTLTHIGSDGSRGVDRILRTGLDVSRWAENIACGHPTPEAVVQGWMSSPGHRANILDGRLTHIGVAVALSDSGRQYWVQNFATLR